MENFKENDVGMKNTRPDLVDHLLFDQVLIVLENNVIAHGVNQEDE